MKPVKVSVVIPLRRVNGYVREALEHLARQTYRDFDVYVVTDEREPISHPGLTVHALASGPVPPNVKRMQAASASSADVVALLDDDAYPVPDWLTHAMAHFSDPGIVGVGGPGVTPPGDSPAQQISGAIYASPLVSAGYVYRYVPGQARDVDDYPSCNLFVRRDAFLRHVGSCLRYWPGEDTKLCLLLTRVENKRIVYDPNAIVYHHRRRLFWGHFRQVWNYAVHRGFFAKRYPQTSLRAQYFVPTLFVVANVAALPALAYAPARVVVGTLAATYLAALALATLASRIDTGRLLVGVGIYLTHLTYGLGFLSGFARPELDH